jgi:flap endonuclease-1
MGIKSFNNILKNFAAKAIKKVSYNELQGKVIAIDTSIYLYRFKYSTGNIVNGFSHQILKFLKNGITPYYIFDGIPPQEKQEVLDGRKNRKTNLHNKCEMLKNIADKEFNIDKYMDNNKIDNKNTLKNYYHTIAVEKLTEEKIDKEIKKIQKQIITVGKDDITCLKELFELFGIPYHECNGEAETFCAVMSKNKIVHGCLTEDTDYLATGGRFSYKGFNISSKELIQVDLNVILEELEFTYDQFLDMCILCGCDYTTKIKGIGPITAMKLIKKYESIEKVLEHIKEKGKHKIPSNFNYEKARQLFKEPDFKFNKEELMKKCKVKEPNKEQIINYMGGGITNTLRKDINKLDRYVLRVINVDKAVKKFQDNKSKKNNLISSYFVRKTQT